MTTTQPYIPTHLARWTNPDSYMGASWPEYYSAGVGQHRDSDALSRSNFACMVRALGGESETVLVIRASHWAVGWVEWIAIHESDTTTLQTADALVARLADYPVLDDDHFSATEQADADETWRNCYSEAGRIAYMREHRTQFEFHSWTDLRAQVRGDYFGGYASELIY